jgi:hypothetical protein
VGFSDFDAWTANADGTMDTQAGSHPYEMTLVFGLNVATPRAAAPGESRLEQPIDGEAHAVTFDLPPGLVGAPTAVPRCTHQQLESVLECPRDTRVGTTVADIAYRRGCAQRWGQ